MTNVQPGLAEELITADGVFAIDAKQIIVYWSDTAEAMLGYKAEDVLGKPCYEIVGGQDSEHYRFCRRDCPIFSNAKSGKPTPDYDMLCATADAEWKWLNVSVVLPKPDRKPFQVVHLIRDVTSRRSTEEFAHKVSKTIRGLYDEAQERLPQAVETFPPPLPKLSRRETEVLGLLAAGLTTQQIADSLQVQPVTARNHIARLLGKLGVSSRIQAVVYASQHKLI